MGCGEFFGPAAGRRHRSWPFALPLALPLALALGGSITPVPAAAFAHQGGTASAAPPPAAAAADGEEEPAPADLSRDPRLRTSVRFGTKSGTVEEVVEAVAKAAGVRLAVDEAVSHRRVSALARDCAARDVMAAVARVGGLTWRPGDGGGSAKGHDYRLLQTRADARREKKLVRDSELREARAQASKQKALLQAMGAAIAGRGSGPPSVADLLAGFSRAELQRAAAVAAQTPGVISAGNDQSHYLPHLLSVRPFKELSPDVQRRVAAIVGRPEFDAAGASGRFAPPTGGVSGLSQKNVGIVASGSISLALIDPDGKNLWVSPIGKVRRKGLPGIDSDNDLPPEVDEALRQRALVDLTELPRERWRRKTLRFVAKLDRRQLGEVLEAVALQTGFTFVADDFLRSRRTPFSWLLTDQDEYTLDEALNQIARAFQHRVVYRQGVLHVQTVSPGLDLREEPPPALLRRFDALRESKSGRMELRDYLELGRLTPSQFRRLQISGLLGSGLNGQILRSVVLMDALRFYTSLSGEQQKSAEAEAGLARRDMSREQQSAFDGLALSGAAAEEPGSGTDRAAGLYVRRGEIKPGAERLTIALVREKPTRRATAYTVPPK